MRRSLLPLCFCLSLFSTFALNAAEGPNDGVHAIIETGYDFGLTAWSDPLSPERSEFSARVSYPADLHGGPYPLVLILHGRHEATYNPDSTSVANNWPPVKDYVPIPNNAGYDWLAQPLARHGCIVVSVAVNGVTDFDNFYGDQADSIRQRIVREHLNLWRRLASVGDAPFGKRFVDAIDLDKLALVGHSRGGAVMVDLARELIDEGDTSLAALALLAPTNRPRRFLPDLPTAIMVGQLDGDGMDLAGVHYFDDGRWQAAAPRYLGILTGGNHNYFNRNWDPDHFSHGAKNDDILRPDWALNGASQRAAAAVWMGAFFRQHLFDDQSYAAILRGNQALPGSLAQIDFTSSWQPAIAERRALNSALLTSHDVVNDRGGAVTSSGDLTAQLIGGGFPLPDQVISVENFRSYYAEVHWGGDLDPGIREVPGLRQHRLTWTGNNGVWKNALPSGQRDWQNFRYLGLRLGLNFEHPNNPTNQDRRLTIRLQDGSGSSASAQVVATWPAGNEFIDHPSRTHMPRLLLNQLRLPLSDFTGVDLSDIRSISLLSNLDSTGDLLLADLALLGITNAPPTVGAITLSDATPAVGTVFSAAISASDSDGDDLTINWDWGDGSDGSGENALHSYTAPAVYVISVQISDGIHTIRRSISIDASASNSAPLLGAIADQVFAAGESERTIPLSVSDDGDLSDLHWWITSSDPSIIDRPYAQVFIENGAYQLSLRPFSSRSGNTNVTLHCFDGALQTTRSFQLSRSASTTVPAMEWTTGFGEGVFNTGLVHTERWFLIDNSAQLQLTVVDRDSLYYDDDYVDLLTPTVTIDDTTVLPQSRVSFTRQTNSTFRYLVDLDLSGLSPGSTELSLQIEDQHGNRTSCTMLLHLIADNDNSAPVITLAQADPAAPIQRSAWGLRALAEDPDDGPAPLRYRWDLASPWPTGMDYEAGTWSLLPGNLSATGDAYFHTTQAGLLPDGNYSFICSVHDGLAVTSTKITVPLSNRWHDLQARWTMDESSGTRFDSWAYGAHLRPIGEATSAVGKRGRALQCNGNTLLQAHGLGAKALELPQSFSIALWCQPASISGLQTLVAGGAGPGWALQLDDGQPRLIRTLADGSQQTLAATQSLVLDQWSHLVASCDSSTGELVLWLNGEQIATDTLTGNTLPVTGDLSVGGRPEVNEGFEGLLDELMIFDSAHGAASIDEWYTSGLENQAPLLKWTAPISGRQAFPSGSAVDLELAVVDPEGANVSVTIFLMPTRSQSANESQPLVTLTEAPYRWTWTAPEDGTHTLIALADDGERLGGSPLHFVVVGAPLTFGEKLRKFILDLVEGYIWVSDPTPVSDQEENGRQILDGLDPKVDHTLQLVPANKL